MIKQINKNQTLIETPHYIYVRLSDVLRSCYHSLFWWFPNYGIFFLILANWRHWRALDRQIGELHADTT